MAFDDISAIAILESKARGANMRPIWGRQDPGGPHVGTMNFAIWDISNPSKIFVDPKSPDITIIIPWQVDSPDKGWIMQGFDVFFIINLNIWLKKESNWTRFKASCCSWDVTMMVIYNGKGIFNIIVTVAAILIQHLYSQIFYGTSQFPNSINHLIMESNSELIQKTQKKVLLMQYDYKAQPVKIFITTLQGPLLLTYIKWDWSMGK